MSDVTPKTESGRAWHERLHNGVLDPCDYLPMILEIENDIRDEAASKAVAEVPELVAIAISGLQNGGGITYNEALEIGQRVALIASERPSEKETGR